MISFFHLVAIARDVDQVAVARLIRRLCWELRQGPQTFTTGERAFLAAVARWKPTGPRPPPPSPVSCPIDPDEARRLAGHVADPDPLEQETR